LREPSGGEYFAGEAELEYGGHDIERDSGGESQRKRRAEEKQSVDNGNEYETAVKSGQGERQPAHCQREKTVDGSKPDEWVDERQVGGRRYNAESCGEHDACDTARDQHGTNERSTHQEMLTSAFHASVSETAALVR